MTSCCLFNLVFLSEIGGCGIVPSSTIIATGSTHNWEYDIRQSTSTIHHGLHVDSVSCANRLDRPAVHALRTIRVCSQEGARTEAVARCLLQPAFTAGSPGLLGDELFPLQ